MVNRGFWLSLGLLLATVVGVLFATRLLLAYLLPFVMALALAAAIEPVVGWLTRRGLPRGVASATALTLLICVLGSLLAGAAARLIVEIGQFVSAIPGYSSEVASRLEYLAELYGKYTAAVPKALEDTIQGQVQTLFAIIEGVARSTLQALSGLPGFVMVTVVTVIATFFLSRDKKEINAFFLSLFTPNLRERLTRVRREVIGSALGFAGAYLMLMALTAVITVAGLSLIGARYGLAVGILVGFLDVLPAVGPAAIFVPWIVYSFTFGSVAFGVKLAVVLAVMSVARQVIEPRLIGERTGLHPLATLLAIYLGLRLFGATGFVVGPLAAIVVRSIARAGLLPGWGASGAK
jgi:sporulation integral membrane protein YtvI